MGNPRKAWEIQGKHGKSREGMGNPGRVGNPRIAWETQESMENPGKSWERTGNHRKSCEILAKAAKTQEMLLKPGKSRAFFLVYNIIFMSGQNGHVRVF